MHDYLSSLVARLAADGSGMLLALGGAMMLMGMLLMRSYALYWRHGIEARAEILKTYGPKMGDMRFEDQSGQVHLFNRCLAPRYGMLKEGTTWVVTYLPGKPKKWNWRSRRYHRWNTFFSLYIVVLGLGVVAMGLQPLWPAWLQELGQTLIGHRHREGWMEALPPPRPR